METIFKYPLDVVHDQFIEVPSGAITLTVQVQHGIPCLWVRCNSDNEKVKREIITHRTGHNVPDTTGDYIGSYQLNNGALVFHVFEQA